MYSNYAILHIHYQNFLKKLLNIENNMKKVLAIASGGGHWVQLLRLLPAFKEHEITFVSTNEVFSNMVSPYTFYTVADSNRKSTMSILRSVVAVMRIVFKVRPDIIITTGAAPGLMFICVGKLMGAKTIWVDSIANVEKISMSGQIASKMADRTYTQWPELSNEKIIYSGNVIS